MTAQTLALLACLLPPLYDAGRRVFRWIAIEVYRLDMILDRIENHEAGL